MGDVIYGHFAEQVFREQVSVEEWRDIPHNLRRWAILWRDGYDIRQECSRATYFRARRALLDYGVDIGVACNVTALVRRSREVEVRQLDARRVA